MDDDSALDDVLRIVRDLPPRELLRIADELKALATHVEPVSETELRAVDPRARLFGKLVVISGPIDVSNFSTASAVNDERIVELIDRAR